MHLSTLSLVGSALPLALASEGYMHLPVSKRASQGVPRSKRDLDFNTGLYNNQNEYIINITVGTPPQNLGVTLDTGSADLWVPAVSSKPCESGKCDFGSFDPKKSSSYNIIDEGGFNITYAAAGDYDAGNWVEESVTVGSSSTINNTIIGVALNGADQHGVLGVGYDTNEAQPNPSKNGSYPNVLDHMVSEGLLNRKAYGLYLNDINATDGSICFGCVDTTKYTGDLVALPLQLPDAGAALDPNIPNAFYVTITQVAFIDAAGKETVVSPDDYAQSALLDSGTSLTYINTDVFSSLAIGLGALQVGSGNYFVPCSYANSNATIRYTFGGEGGPQIDIPMASVIFGDDIPSSEFKSETGDDACALGMAGPSGDVVLGDTFLRNAYIVYDLDNYQVAIAQAKVGQAGTSSLVVIPTGTDIPGVSSTATATGTQLNSAALTAVPTGISAAGSTASTFSAPTPTFNLGGQATSSGAKGTGVESTSSSSSKGAAPTAGPQAAMLGVLAAGALFL